MSSKGILNIIYFIYLHLHVSTFPLCVKIYQVTASMAHQYINILQYNIISRYMKCKIYQSRVRLLHNSHFPVVQFAQQYHQIINCQIKMVKYIPPLTIGPLLQSNLQTYCNRQRLKWFDNSSTIITIRMITAQCPNRTFKLVKFIQMQ